VKLEDLKKWKESLSKLMTGLLIKEKEKEKEDVEETIITKKEPQISNLKAVCEMNAQSTVKDAEQEKMDNFLKQMEEKFMEQQKKEIEEQKKIENAYDLDVEVKRQEKISKLLESKREAKNVEKPIEIPTNQQAAGKVEGIDR
jgi:hypothetical protein